jgi:hypothetical protein
MEAKKLKKSDENTGSAAQLPKFVTPKKDAPSKANSGLSMWFPKVKSDTT